VTERQEIGPVNCPGANQAYYAKHNRTGTRGPTSTFFVAGFMARLSGARATNSETQTERRPGASAERGLGAGFTARPQFEPGPRC